MNDCHYTSTLFPFRTDNHFAYTCPSTNKFIKVFSEDKGLVKLQCENTGCTFNSETKKCCC
jgi:hypothetical protein